MRRMRKPANQCSGKKGRQTKWRKFYFLQKQKNQKITVTAFFLFSIYAYIVFSFHKILQWLRSIYSSYVCEFTQPATKRYATDKEACKNMTMMYAFLQVFKRLRNSYKNGTIYPYYLHLFMLGALPRERNRDLWYETCEVLNAL